VARIEQLEFLSDIIPRTMTYKSAAQRKEKALNAPDSPDENGTSGRKIRKGGGRTGGIERYFSSKEENNGMEEITSGEEMDVD